MSDGIKLNGFEKLEALLNQLPDDVAKKSGIAALRKAARVVLEEAKRKVPVRTGKLRDSLSIRVIKARRPIVKVFASRKKGGYHAHLVELGTKPHMIPGPVSLGDKVLQNIQHPGQVKNPFMRPALIEKQNEALAVFFDDIFKQIEKQFKKILK